MEIMIALLRGVNVGGRTIRMNRLKAIFEGLGFSSVRTYIQSGNVLFVPPEGMMCEEIRVRIEEGILRETGFDVAAVLLTAAEIGSVVTGDPWAGAALNESERVYVTVLQDEPGADALKGLAPVAGSLDEYRVSGRLIYILCRGGYHETEYSNAFFEKKLKVKATTRNLDTMAKLAELAGDIEKV